MKDALVLKSAVIEVSDTPNCKDGIYVDVRLQGILPDCRKAVKLSFSPYFEHIVVVALFPHKDGYTEAYIHPEDWRKMVRTIPVVNDDLCPVKDFNEEIVNKARARAEELCDCPAVTSTKHVKEGYHHEKFHTLILPENSPQKS